MSIQSIHKNFTILYSCVGLGLFCLIIQSLFPNWIIVKILLAVLSFVTLGMAVKNQNAIRILIKEFGKRLGDLETTDYDQKFYFGKLVAAGNSIIKEQEGDALMRKIRDEFASITKASAGYLLLYNQNQNHYEWGGGIGLSHLKLKTYPNPIPTSDGLMRKILSNVMNPVLVFDLKPLVSDLIFHVREDSISSLQPYPDSLITLKMQMKDSVLGILFLLVTKTQSLDIEKNILVFQSFVNQATLALGSAIQREFAINDRMTMMYNHEYFVSRLREEIGKCESGRTQQLSVLMMDIDHFKKFNDSYGHQIGDLVLIEASRLYKSCVRISDIVARYGGEEFAIILPETALKDAIGVAEKIRQTIEANPFKTEKGDLKVTISIGCCEWQRGQTPPMTVESMVKHADIKLYECKEKGRNRVCY